MKPPERPSSERPGFLSALFSLFSYKPIVEYIDAQFEAYLQEELKIKRSLFNYHDTRIHACLYFIAPTGHSLKSLDLVTMKKLDSKVLAAHVTTLAWPHSCFHDLATDLVQAAQKNTVCFLAVGNGRDAV